MSTEKKYNWKEIVQQVQTAGEVRYEFNMPITEIEIKKFRSILGLTIPADLLSLYKQANGIYAITENNTTRDLIWSAAKLAKENIELRTNSDFSNLYMPFNNLLFFSDTGEDALYAFPVINGKARSDVFVWDHKTDSRVQVALTLEQFIRDRAAVKAESLHGKFSNL